MSLLNSTCIVFNIKRKQLWQWIFLLTLWIRCTTVYISVFFFFLAHLQMVHNNCLVFLFFFIIVFFLSIDIKYKFGDISIFSYNSIFNKIITIWMCVCVCLSVCIDWVNYLIDFFMIQIAGRCCRFFIDVTVCEC